jgi:hypothetical protein
MVYHDITRKALMQNTKERPRKKRTAANDGDIVDI